MVVAPAARENLGKLRDAEDFARLVGLNGASTALDGLAGLARRILGVPLAQINVIIGEEQVSLSSVAVDAEWGGWNGPRSTPRESSFCQHVIRTGEPLVVEDSRTHPLVRDNPATTEAGVRSYAAIPLKNQAGQPLATLCVVSSTAREWTPHDLDSLSALADLLMSELRGRLSAELALHESEIRLQSLVEHGTDLITVLDSDARIRYQSPAYGRTLGYGKGTLEGREFGSLIHPRDVERFRRLFLDPLRRNGSAVSTHWRMGHADGSWRTVRGTGVNRLDDPAVRGLVLNIHDVTQERQLEAELHQAQKMEAVGRLAGGVAHDFNNLLTAIRGNAEFLTARQDLPADARADAREIMETSNRAAGLTKQLLTFSRAQPLELTVLDVGDLADRMVTLVSRLVGVNISIRASFQRDLLVEADESQLSQVIMNLAVNARDAMKEGGDLRLETHAFTATAEYSLSHSDMQPGEYALLVVADDGEGMSREVQHRIFEPFYTTKPSGEGTGLGLSICWGIVRQMGGHIHLYSEPGRGTTFKLYFPRVADRPESRPSREVETKTRAQGTGSASILVVEDQAEVRRVVMRVLQAGGHTVLEAESAEKALALLANPSARIDLLLTDVLLPGMNGSDLAWELAGRWPDLSVLFTSGFTQGELSDQRVDMRQAAFLAKPFGPRELSDAVERALGRGGEEEEGG